MKKTTTLVLALFLVLSSFAQNKEIKNVILMIPDGTSLAAVSSARWYQRYLDPENTNLHIDPYMCGTVLTFSSNAPIGDSAPTTSCFMTGYPSRAGWVSTYPTADPTNDILTMDPTMAYQPLMTVLEAARITKGKATGLVFTCEFPHATPADCSAHSYDRGKYNWIVPQMVHNQLDVVIGGGVSLMKDEYRKYLENKGYGVFTNDINSFRSFEGNQMWSLFCDNAMAYDIDRDPAQEPSIAEMTQRAIEKLSTNPNGFFLMVEGSKIDWAAHANDATGIITDMIAFDKACGVAFDFAKQNGETVVVVVPDHGNSGISIGEHRCPGYGTLTKDQLFSNITRYKVTRDEMINRLHRTEAKDFKKKMYELSGLELSDELLDKMMHAKDYKHSPVTEDDRKEKRLGDQIRRILDDNTCFGFTTGGHTGEEVFLAVYDPTPNRLMGHKTNVELNHYLRQSLGLEQPLEDLTASYFAKHQDVFAGYKYEIVKDGDNSKLVVKNKKKTLEVKANTNYATLNGKTIPLESVVVYVDKNDTFYLPQTLGKELK